MGTHPSEKSRNSNGRMDSLPSLSSGVQVVEVGDQGTPSFRLVYLDTEGHGISPWSHIPLYNRDGDIHVICSMPQQIHCQMEVSWNEIWRPLRLKLNSKKEVISFSESASWNVGIIPQTLADEDDVEGLNGGLSGDGRPLEIIDIGSTSRALGEVYAVKPVSAFAVLRPDTFQVSWKIIGIAADDPSADTLNDVSDVAEKFPGLLESVREWLRHCPSDSPDLFAENLFGHNERAQDLEKVLWVIDAAHACWQSQASHEPEYEKLKFEKSPYEPKTWARKFGVRSFSDAVPETSTSVADDLNSKLKPQRAARPAYFQPKRFPDKLNFTKNQNKGEVVLLGSKMGDLALAKGENLRVAPFQVSLSDKSIKTGKWKSVQTFARSETEKASRKTSSLDADPLLKEKRVRWADYVEVWEIPPDVETEERVLEVSLCKAPVGKNNQSKKPSVPSEAGPQKLDDSKKATSKGKILRNLTGCVSMGTQAQ